MGTTLCMFQIEDREVIKCNTIEYRKGFIEVRGDINNDNINVEVLKRFEVTHIILGVSHLAFYGLI